MPTLPHYAPRIQALSISGVALYEDGNELDIDLSAPINSFVGANGVGKSTLLALTNFAITGLVPDPSASFQSVDEYVDRTASFARSFFGGRVDENDRDVAVVRVTFLVGSLEMTVTRGLFDGRLTRSFECLDSTTGKATRASSDDLSQSDVTLHYQELVTSAAGLATFEQFCFWQLFIMTFDERRHLLFWDDKTLQAALMISLGQTLTQATSAESMGRRIERLDSLARNARWRATQASNRRNRLLRAQAGAGSLTTTELADLHDRQVELEDRLKALTDGLALAEQATHDSSRRVAEFSISAADLERSYAAAFSSQPRRHRPDEHPILVSIGRDHYCELCGSQPVELGNLVKGLIADAKCPLCESPIVSEHPSREMDELLRLDSELAATRSGLDQERLRYQRLRSEQRIVAEQVDQAAQELRAFTKENSSALRNPGSDVSDERIRQLDAEIASGMAEAEQLRRERDAIREELEPIIAALAESYQTVETEFVPTFRALAGQFIGRQVDVEFERSGVDLGLRFSLDGQSRRNPTELSESQQFFLDISLRMSLVRTFLHADATFLVDTPEGSLDIAYETRAGRLFEAFAEAGSSIFMTSNLNASNLMLSLASVAGDRRMTLHRMTEWVRLSDIQLEASDLFEAAFEKIETALAEAPVNP